MRRSEGGFGGGGGGGGGDPSHGLMIQTIPTPAGINRGRVLLS